MKHSKNLSRAIDILKLKCEVIPEKYAMYNGSFMFMAYPPDMKDKSNSMNPYYLVDLKREAAGHFSPAFDLDGFFAIVENMKPC